MRVVALALLAAAVSGEPALIPLGVGDHGIGFDDLQFAPALKRVLVPAGGTGTLFLLDPVTRELDRVPGFTTGSFHGGHDQGTTSAAEVAGPPIRVVATDRETRTLRVVDPAALKIIASVDLGGKPDYVRVVPSTGEVWVTEPSRKQIEVLRFRDLTAGRLARVALVPVPDGPESLVIDEARGRAYTHSWGDRTFALDLHTRKVAGSWRNGCQHSRGIALDAARGLLFAGCAEGRATVVDLKTERVLSIGATGPDVDSIAYAAAAEPALRSGRRHGPVVHVPRAAGRQAGARPHPAPRRWTCHTAAFDPQSRVVFLGASSPMSDGQLRPERSVPRPRTSARRGTGRRSAT